MRGSEGFEIQSLELERERERRRACWFRGIPSLMQFDGSVKIDPPTSPATPPTVTPSIVRPTAERSAEKVRALIEEAADAMAPLAASAIVVREMKRL